MNCTTVVYIPKRGKKPKVVVYDAHIDKVNNIRSKSFIPDGAKILEMGIGDKFYPIWCKKYLDKKK
jgi:hypothetical protein|tara:strand:+ start:127 stop:324 length:198 start_codon:yes stop_codon:yes gene_type:complete